MVKPNTEWTVLEHGPLERLSENLWHVSGALPGMSLKRSMTVVRLNDGGLVLHSAMALRESELRELEACGRPRHLLVPNRYHRLDAPAYKRRYPELRVFAPRGSRAKVEAVVPVDGVYEDFPHDETVSLAALPGIADHEGVMIVRSQDGVSVVLTDIVFNMDRKRDLFGFLFTTLCGSGPGPRVSRLAKWMFVEDAKALRGELERLSQTPNLVRLIVAHEKVASGRAAAEALLRAASYL